MSLRIILKDYLELNKRVSRDKLREIGFDNKYDSATTDRALRKLTEQGHIKPSKGSKRFNSEYVWIDTKKVTTGLKQPLKCTYDDDLEEILRSMVVTWDNYEQIRLIKTLIRGKSVYNKKQYLKTYEYKNQNQNQKTN